MERSPFLFFIAILLISACSTPTDSPKQSPNVLLIMTDDQGFGDVGIHGNDSIYTPVLDKLAKQGIRMDNFYVSPVCAPTRASLLTGRYHYRTGTTWVTRNGEAMRSEEVTLAEVFKANHYATGCFGKWHNGGHYPQNPTGQGFDDFTGFCAGHWSNYFDPPLESNGEMIQTRGYITDIITDSAVSFINKHLFKTPFFCYVPYNTPHTPYILPEHLFQKYKQQGLSDKVAATYGMVESIDRNVGRLLELLERNEQLENTLVIFITDNGPNYDRYNQGMKGRKGWINDGGVRVPCFIYWKGQLEGARTLQNLTAHIDVLPTLVDLLGLKPVETLPLDGVSFAGLLTGENTQLPERNFFSFATNLNKYRGSVRTQDLRLTVTGEDEFQLTRLLDDPEEQNDLKDKMPEIALQMYRDYLDAFDEVTKESVDFMPLPLGHAAAPKSYLQGHEGFFKGNIQYSTSQYGWANDWFKNWTTTEDTIYWNVDLAEAGNYHFALQYNCLPENIGSRIRLQSSSERLEAIIDRPFVSEIIPNREKVARRVEAVEKTWGILDLGSMNLQAGPQQLLLTATEISGAEVAEIKALIVEKKSSS